MFCLLFLFSRGSVIANVTIKYKYINRDQVVNFMDMMKKGTISNMAVGEYSVSSKTSKCYHFQT